jgi:hypothetical protein
MVGLGYSEECLKVTKITLSRISVQLTLYIIIMYVIMPVFLIMSL